MGEGGGRWLGLGEGDCVRGLGGSGWVGDGLEIRIY